MSSSNVAMQRYRSLSEHTRSAKDLEYDVILEVTRELSQVRTKNTSDFPLFAKILNKNERLWITIGTQVADSGNQLEPNLRARLFYLAEFVIHQTSLVLAGKANIESLVETNVAILRGLKGAN